MTVKEYMILKPLIKIAMINATGREPSETAMFKAALVLCYK